mmetsp:Transcript_123384/g.240067  ORF Transcript_123384/g.240067 Transcript_123384/m.240067 type:complete len:426 (+) Transcript_123384:2-1279(+)
MTNIARQLIGALQHMHKRGLLYRALRAQNVLVDAEGRQPLLSNFCDTCAIGATDPLDRYDVAPEVCRGGVAQGPEVDCWGMGNLLRHVYIGCSELLIMRRPETRPPMPGDAEEAMEGLTQFKLDSRWSLEHLRQSSWLQTHKMQPVIPLSANIAELGGFERVFLRRFSSCEPLPPSYGLHVTSEHHSHIIGKPLARFATGGINMLLSVADQGRRCQHACNHAKVEADTWIYFGLPIHEPDFMVALHELSRLLRPPDLQPGDSVPLRLVQINVHFDCFSFPAHTGAHFVRVHHILRCFNVPLVGIQRPGQVEVDWHPEDYELVNPGDMGLMARIPDSSGSSRPLFTDAELAPLMDEHTFDEQMQDEASIYMRQSPQARHIERRRADEPRHNTALVAAPVALPAAKLVQLLTERMAHMQQLVNCTRK